jgi:hypothetical protein
MTSFILFVPLKFPFLILEFKDGMNLGEGFFVTQPEFLNVTKVLCYIAYSILALLLLNSTIFEKYVLNNDKILKLVDE